MEWVPAIWLVCLLCVPFMAASKHRNGWIWFLLTLFFGVFTVLVLSLLRDDPHGPLRKGEQQCGSCLAFIPEDATRCRYCTTLLETPSETPAPAGGVA